jgi:hypothetical protein
MLKQKAWASRMQIRAWVFFVPFYETTFSFLPSYLFLDCLVELVFGDFCASCQGGLDGITKSLGILDDKSGLGIFCTISKMTFSFLAKFIYIDFLVEFKLCDI